MLTKKDKNLIIQYVKKYSASRDNPILAGFIFGSQIKKKTNKYSDIDIAILFDEKINKDDYTDRQIEIANNLSKILNKEIDVIALNEAPLFLKYHILKNGRRLYESPDRKGRTFEARSIVEYLDFLPIKNMIEKRLLAKIKEA